MLCIVYYSKKIFTRGKVYKRLKRWNQQHEYATTKQPCFLKPIQDRIKTVNISIIIKEFELVA